MRLAGRLGIVVLLLLCCCATATGYDSPLPTPRVSKVIIPAVYRNATAETSTKKGVALYTAPCSVLSTLGVAWYYSGPECAGPAYVPYVANPWDMQRVILSPGLFMFANEPDAPYFNPPPIDMLVKWSVRAIGDRTDAVGPCVAYDLGYVEQFWRLYRELSGLPGAKPAAICYHCYGNAADCIARTQEAIRVADRLAVSEVWLTEFGMTRGWDTTLRQTSDEMQALVEYLEGNPRVGRYAYWPGGVQFGDGAPGDPLTGWQPLAYEWYRWDGSVEWRLTALGQAYAGW
jgi:hypothetical protein